MSALQQIQTAPEVVVVLGQDDKQLRLLDAKTMALLSPSMKDGDVVVAPVAYSSQTEQVIAAQAVKTIVNVWNTDQEAPSFKASLSEKLTCLQVDPSETVLLGGGESGTLYVWELPSGLLLRKFPAHNKKIIGIAVDDELCITTASHSEAKVWSMLSVFCDQAKEIRHKQMVNMKDRLLDIKVANGRLLVLSESAALVYKLHNAEKEQVFQMEGASCFSCDPTSNHLYVGSSSGAIVEFRIDKSTEYHEVVLGADGIEIVKTAKERTLVGHKHAVSCLTWMNSLKYLVSGSKQGELIVWQNGQIKKQITLKLELCQLLTIPRPSNHRPNSKKVQISRMKALHKYEQKNNQTEQLEWICRQQPYIPTENPEHTFSAIMKELANEKGQLLSTIQSLKHQNNTLMKCAEHYAEHFLDKFDSA